MGTRGLSRLITRVVVNGSYLLILTVGVRYGFELSQGESLERDTVRSVGTEEIKPEVPREKKNWWSMDFWWVRPEWSKDEEIVVEYFFRNSFLFAKTEKGEEVVLIEHSRQHYFKWMDSRKAEFLTTPKFQKVCRPFLFFFQSCSPPISNRIRTRMSPEGFKYGVIVP